MTTKSRYGPWALVTGASSGIGEEFARQLAANGLNLVVTARSEDKLRALARELEAQHGVQVRCVPIDLSLRESPAKLIADTLDLEIGLLVSNAGHVVPGAFLGRDASDYEAVIQLNVTSPMVMAHHFGRRMAARGRGGIVFTSSIGGFGPMPWMANYSGTKAYLLSFGAALRYELARHGVDVTVLAPGPTDTPMATTTSALRKIVVPLMKVAPVVSECLRRLPHAPVIVPGLRLKLMITMMTRLLPRRLFTRVWGLTLEKTMEPSVLVAKLDTDSITPTPSGARKTQS